MVDTYRFSIPIEFRFEVPGGESNPDLRQKLKDECAKVIHNLLRGEESQTLFDYPVEVDEKKMVVACWLGYLGTKHAPNRFRSREIITWKEVASELVTRSKADYGGQKHTKKNLIRKADIPYFVGRWAYSVRASLSRFEYISFRQEELLRLWHAEYKVKTPLPVNRPVNRSVKPKVKIRLTKAQRAWIAIGRIDNPEDEAGTFFTGVTTGSASASIGVSSPVAVEEEEF